MDRNRIVRLSGFFVQHDKRARGKTGQSIRGGPKVEKSFDQPILCRKHKTGSGLFEHKTGSGLFDLAGIILLLEEQTKRPDPFLFSLNGEK